jgi:RimJ/RimL family protein N-acetyltransferase
MLKPLQLHTPRLRLRPATALDCESMQHLWPEAELPRWRGNAPGAGGAGLWVIALADGTQDIGCVGLRPSTIAPRLCEGSDEPFEPLLLLHSEHRGQGYAQEAMRAVLWHAQSATRGRCFVAVCDVPNTAGDRLLRRLGFVPGYEADGGAWRVRQYRLPLRSASPATP